jgi:hypothetical protein
MGVNINATRCAEYLRMIGVPVSDGLAAAWVTQESDHRARKRAHNRELKKSCGHFRAHWTRVHHGGGTTDVRNCIDCGAFIEYRGASLSAPTP